MHCILFYVIVWSAHVHLVVFSHPSVISWALRMQYTHSLSMSDVLMCDKLGFSFIQSTCLNLLLITVVLADTCQLLGLKDCLLNCFSVLLNQPAKHAYTPFLFDQCSFLTRSHKKEWCNPWPHVANRHMSISQLLSLWYHSHYDIICASCAYGTRSRHSHHDVMLIVTSFATELATPSITDVRYGHLTAFNI